METGNEERRTQNRERMVLVPGKDYDRAFWPADVRYIEGTENGSRIYLFDEKDRVTLFTPLSVADVINAIQEITDPPMLIPGYDPEEAMKAEECPDDAPITVTVLDTYTMMRRDNSEHSYQWWTEGHGVNDGGRAPIFGEHPRFIITATSHGDLSMLNHAYPVALLTAYDIPSSKVQPSWTPGPSITVTVLDTVTGAQVEDNKHDWDWWAGGGGAYDHFRESLFWPARAVASYDRTQQQRYIIVAARECSIGGLNYGYPADLLARYDIPNSGVVGCYVGRNTAVQP